MCEKQYKTKNDCSPYPSSITVGSLTIGNTVSNGLANAIEEIEVIEKVKDGEEKDYYPLSIGKATYIDTNDLKLPKGTNDIEDEHTVDFIGDIFLDKHLRTTIDGKLYIKDEETNKTITCDVHIQI